MHDLPVKEVVTEFIEGHKQFSHLTKKEKEEKKSANSIAEDDR